MDLQYPRAVISQKESGQCSVLKEAVTNFMGHCRNVPPHSPGELRCIIYSCIKVWMCVRGDGETRASCPSFLSVHSGADVVVQKGSISSALSFLSNISFFSPAIVFLMWMGFGFLCQDSILYFIMVLSMAMSACPLAETTRYAGSHLHVSL